MLFFTCLKDSESSNSALELLGWNCHFHALAFIRIFLLLYLPWQKIVPIPPHC